MQRAATGLGEAGAEPERAASSLLQGVKKYLPAVKYEGESDGPSL